eukprot:scaffold103896_cov47-Prasinocladus_malaysianus.AAC.2
MPGSGRMPRKLEEELANAGARIVDPSGGRGGQGNITGRPPPIIGGGLEMPGQAAPTHNKFKPPPGFAQEDGDAWTNLDAQFKSMDPNQLLDMLSTKAGYWHTLAKVPSPYKVTLSACEQAVDRLNLGRNDDELTCALHLSCPDHSDPEPRGLRHQALGRHHRHRQPHTESMDDVSVRV